MPPEIGLGRDQRRSAEFFASADIAGLGSRRHVEVRPIAYVGPPLDHHTREARSAEKHFSRASALTREPEVPPRRKLRDGDLLPIIHECGTQSYV